jgi:Na+-transporting NADH:ubiquinone oxidoreductase subunit C
MKQSRYFAVIYMFVLTAVLSTMLIGLERLTRQRVKTNEQIAFERAVVSVFPQIEIKSPTEIHPVFTRDFVLSETAGGAYEYRPLEQLAGFALPFEGQGFWSTIRGVIGIQTDLKTITGIQFYEQAETPGLGARIVEPFFYGQFAQKTLTEGQRPVRIRPESEAGANDIQAITGATQTCVRLEKLLNEAIVQWRQKMLEQGK